MGRPKSVSIPPPPPPLAMPEIGPETEDWAMKLAKRKKGYQKTILTGELSPISTGKRTQLGYGGY